MSSIASLRTSCGLSMWGLLCAFVLINLVPLAGCQRPAEPPAAESPTASSPESTDPDATATPGGTSPAATESQSASKSTPTENAPLQYVNPLTSEEIAAGWILLFDNETLFGWQKQNDVNWAVKDGAITASTGPIGLLLTDVSFADFELAVEFRGEPGSNGGVFLRCSESPQDPSVDCYEVNIADSHPAGFLTGSIVAHQPADPGIATTDDQWHQLLITAAGNVIQVSVDGKTLPEFRDERESRLLRGRIGLQKNSSAVAYRNLKLRPLADRELFNGKDLAGWHEVPGSQSVIDVVEGTIHVVNGPGFLESEETFGDFLIQFQARTNAPELNSGLFFRAEKGTAENPSNGYEVQIHNGIKEGDPNRPSNAGTGAIFRRVDARRVVAKDNQWSTITLIADGPRIATWVEGYPVVSWQDERPADPNPRKGSRLEPGHLSLQGHDPTTDMSFRHIRIQPLP